jgi:hypothetical protein
VALLQGFQRAPACPIDSAMRARELELRIAGLMRRNR